MREDEGPTEGSSFAAMDERFQRVLHRVEAMAELAVGMVRDGTRALLESDREAAASVIARDTELDRFDIEIETETMRLIAILQPEGPVLRTLGAVLKIATCLDRVGRLGYDLAQYMARTADPGERAPQDLLREMDEQVRAMLVRAVQAFVHGDARDAKQVFVLDDKVDALYREVQRQLIRRLERGGAAAERLAFELLAARHLERVGDNACKIAEKAVYAITGERRTEYLPPEGSRPSMDLDPS